ncbi:hypothetical protein CC80DRAFT_549624 [Byssothecium circinans]|uniref:Uncharacterized protein n=1 Tax=Byssothecium circinans TaxID=147558 RepID=A0A6A5TR62_9PLEO|nr:hypothetical protein CC80DRAFT_549624 [Byssothecium circinans]
MSTSSDDSSFFDTLTSTVNRSLNFTQDMPSTPSPSLPSYPIQFNSTRSNTTTTMLPRVPHTLPKSYNDVPFTQIDTQHHDKEPSIIIPALYRPKNQNAFTNTTMLELEEAYAIFDIDD